jgi:adenylate cyclase
MPKEIERKFLVTGNEWRKRAGRGKAIRQAYLALTNTASIRIRKAFVTIKSAEPGTTRSEFEYPIPVKHAQSLMKLRVGRLIRKRRHIIKAGKARFEIDVFEGDHRGLVIAEIELASARARFKRPEWLGKEVTHEKHYYNASLATA